MVYTSVCVRSRGRGQGGQAFLDIMSFFYFKWAHFLIFSPASHPFVGDYSLIPLGHITATLVGEREAMMDWQHHTQGAKGGVLVLFFTFEEERGVLGKGGSHKNWKGKLGGSCKKFQWFLINHRPLHPPTRKKWMVPYT